ncbi:MAG: hypothetical protein ACE5IR_15615 [bacterium]
MLYLNRNNLRKTLPLLGYITLVLAIGYLSDFHQLPRALGILVTLFIFTMDQLLGKNPTWIAYYFAWRKQIAFFVAIASASLGFIPFYLVYYHDFVNKPSILLTSQFIVQGLVVGVILRNLIVWISYRTLFGATIETQRFLFLLGFTTFLWLCPLGQEHRIYAYFYLVGVGGGFLLHYTIRIKQRKRARRYRRGQTILRVIEFPSEIEAMKYYAKQDWKKLNQLFKDHENQMTTVLKIVKVCMLRIQGKYQEGLKIIEEELKNPDRNKELDAYLYCQKALAHSELDERDLMYKALDKSLKLKPTCLLSKVTKSLRLGEDLEDSLEKKPEMSDEDKEEKNEEPLHEIWGALKLNAQENPLESIAKVIGSAVPVTWTFFLDAYAYALLHVGDFRFSRSLLKVCIKDDPSFSSPYLHLGEWYMKTKTDDKFKKLAKLCLSVALKLEGEKNSLIKRRSEHLRKKLEL